MRIEEAVRAYLIAQSGITNLVGSRIVPSGVDESTELPCIVYFKVSDVVTQTLQGPLGLSRPRFQFSAYALTKSTAMDIAEKVEAALSEYHGTMDDITVQRIILLNRFSSKETYNQNKWFVEDLEFEINYERRSD